MKKILINIFIYIVSISSISLSQIWFNTDNVNSIILLEKKVEDTYIPHGTGFLLYNYDNSNNNILITCAHVLKNKEIYAVFEADSSLINFMNERGLSNIIMGNNQWILNGSNLRTKITLTENETFIKHNKLDIAGFKLGLSSKIYANTKKDSIILDLTSAKGIPRSLIKFRKDVTIGEDVYFLGFPFSIGTQKGYIISSEYGTFNTGNYIANVSNPVLRTGTVSWISKNNKEFLIDALSYGGNSGSPLFTKAGFGKKPFLIGMVIGHLGDQVDLNIVKKNKDLKIESDVQGNIGLARCLWIDDIMAVAQEIRKLK